MKTKLVFVCILATAFVAGCSNPEKAFQEAKIANSIDAYEEFLLKYPDSELVQEAKTLIYTLAFDDASQENTIAAFYEFLHKYKPDSVFVQRAELMIRALRPESGTWTGNDIQFNISPDGRKICKENSTLDNNCSLSLKIRTTGYTMTNFIYEDVEINVNGGFSLVHMDSSYDPSGYISIKGEFTSPVEASGTFTLTDYGTDKINGSTNWIANPAQ